MGADISPGALVRAVFVFLGKKSPPSTYTGWTPPMREQDTGHWDKAKPFYGILPPLVSSDGWLWGACASRQGLGVHGGW